MALHPMLRRIKRGSLGRSDLLLLERAAEALALGGRAGLLVWLQHREQMVRHVSELAALAEIWSELSSELLSLNDKAAAAELSRLEAVEAAASAKRAREAQQAAVERERERRAADPRAAIRTRLERVLAGPAAIRPQPPESPMTQSERQQHWSTDPEHCGIRLGNKIDAVLADIRAMDFEEHPRPRLVWSRSHGEIKETITFPIASVDPPQAMPGGDGSRTSDATAAVGGGIGSGFPLEDPSLWDVLTDGTDLFVDGPLVVYIAKLDESPAFRRGQVATLLTTLKQRLQEMPDSVDGETPVQVAAGDLALITHLLLRHQA